MRRCATPGQTDESPVPYMIMPNHMPFGRPKMPAAEMRSSDTTLNYHAVMAGMGAAFLPDWLVAGDLASGRLIHVDGGRQNYKGQLFAVYPSRRHLPHKLRSFIDFLVQHLDH